MGRAQTHADSRCGIDRGIVSLLVVEGQDVRQGSPVARLIDVDAKLAVREAQSELALREAELQSAEADLQAARLRREHPTHLQASLADAESVLAKAESELAKLPLLIESDTATLEYARQNLAGKQSAGAAVSARLLQEAESNFTAAQANWELGSVNQACAREAEALAAKRAASPNN
jgi:multidrug efflux pump subunit AcrA (membrane-fusion protein)